MNSYMPTKRINYDSAPVPDLNEQITFTPEVCYLLWKRSFPMDEIVPLHYGDFLEILLCTDMEGQITVDRELFSDLKSVAILIPPNVVHSLHIRKGTGTLNTFALPLNTLSHYINLENMLADRNCRIDLLPYRLPFYREFLDVAEELRRGDDDIFARMRALIHLAELLDECFRLSGGRAAASDTPDDRDPQGFDLKRLINWVNENYARDVCIDDIACELGYSKYYFCKLFKKSTGTTFWYYLNQVRITRAQLLLHGSDSITSIALSCGFGNPSNFAQIFKKYTGVTPREFRRELQSVANSVDRA